MDANRFDGIARALAGSRLSRRRAAQAAGIGIAAGALGHVARPAQAQETTPDDQNGKIPFLFLQSYGGGSLAPKDSDAGTYTLTLTDGGGHTVYFSDRPERIVGLAPTTQFLAGLGFPDDDPPNAAIVFETSPTGEDIAAVELFNPEYDETTNAASFDVRLLANYEQELGMTLAEVPADLGSIGEFGKVHLFIDDCADRLVSCLDSNHKSVGTLGPTGYCYHADNIACIPCTPYGHEAETLIKTHNYWSDACNAEIAECNGRCTSDFGNGAEFGH